MSETIKDGDWEYVPAGIGRNGETLYCRQVWRVRPYPNLAPYTQAQIDESGIDNPKKAK